MILVNDLIDQARIKLHDTNQPYRWSVAELLDGVKKAVNHIHSIRPETQYVDGNLSDFEVDSDTEEIPIDSRYEEALVHYVVYWAYLKDDTDVENAQLAESYLARANTLMQI